MKKFLIPAALLASTVAAVSPASAQWAPAPQAYGYPGGYQQPYGNANGYYNNQGQVRALQVRVDRIRREIQQLDRRNILSDREARRLDTEARDLQRRIARLGYNGVNQRERYDVEQRINRLEYQVRREANDRNGRWGNNNNDQWRDRDRDGRNDRWEDDRGRDRD